MSTKRPTRAKQPTRAERLARWLNMGTCGMQDQRDAAAELLRLHAIVAAHEAEKAQAAGGVDCIGLALELESRAGLVESQTTERAMRAAAHGLRLLAGGADPAAPVAGLIFTDEMRADLIRDTAEVFDRNGPFTPQIVRDVIEYVDSALQVLIGKAHGKAKAAPAEPVAAPQGEPVAARYDFDGYGYLYIDNGHGSDWETRIPDAEMLYTKSDEAEIRADERERCAKLCEFEASRYSSPKLNKLLTDHGRRIKEAQGVGALNCANAIRSMGKEGGET